LNNKRREEVPLTLNELKERIVQENIDPCTLCEILDVTVEDILHEFEDKLIDKREEFDDVDDTY
jgi:chaperonin GroEL (HSP60 family)